MNLPIVLDTDFEATLQDLKKAYVYDYMKISGLKPQQMSFTTYIKEFVESNNISDISIDGTSNSDNRDVVALLSDISKPILKLTAYNKIFTKIKEKFGLKDAEDWLTSEYLGKSYLHDAYSSSLMPYCYAYDLTKLANEGLFFLSSDTEGLEREPYNAEPAQHLDTFINLLKEFVSWTCNRTSGAVGLPNLIVYIYYFWYKDIEKKYNGCHFLKDHEGNKITGLEYYPEINDTNENIKYLKQQIQALIYALNQPFLRGGIQCAFTNVSIFDHEYAHALFDGVVFPDGSLAFDHIDNIIKTEQIFMDVVSNIRNKNMFTFPVLSYSLLTEKVLVNGKTTDKLSDEEFNIWVKDDEMWKDKVNFIDRTKPVMKFKDIEFARWASDHNCTWMDSNFFIDSSVTSLSNCCRLKSNISDLGYFNSIGGTALSVGSVKVNSVNLANIAYDILSKKNFSFEEKEEKKENILDNFFSFIEKEYLIKLHDQIYINLKCLDIIRDIITKNAKERKLLPNIADGLIDLKHMYNTVGFIGVYETLKAFQNRIDIVKDLLGNISLGDDVEYIKKDDFGNTFYTKRAENFVKNLFETMHKTFDDFKQEYNISYSINCEQIPGETAANKLMQKDTLSYPQLVVKDLPLYGNQFIPLGIKTTMEERVRVAALFDSFCNGGSIAHLNYESNFPNKDIAWEKLNWLAQQGLTYSAFTTKINACRHNHAFFGNICPECGEGVYTSYMRIVGFYVPVCTFDSARKNEALNYREWEKI